MSRRPVGSIYWRSEGVARIELQSGYDPITGKPRRMSATVHGNQQDAERKLAQMLFDIGKLPSGRAMSLREYLENLYIPSLEKHVRRKTRIGYESKLNLHVIPAIGHLPLAGLEPYALDRWRDGLLENMSGRSALHTYRVLSTALNRAVRWRLITNNPLESVDAPRAQMRDLETLTADEALDYLRAFQGNVIEPIVILALATGLRVCELAGLDWSHVDLAEGTVKVERGLHEGEGETWFEEPKSARSRRIVSLSTWAIDSLKPLKGIGALAVHGRERMRPSMIARLYREQVAASELRYIPLRDLRHTHATLLLEAGVDVVNVSRRLGHSTIAITDAHYLRPKRSADQAASDKLGELLAFTGEKARLAASGEKLASEDDLR